MFTLTISQLLPAGHIRVFASVNRLELRPWLSPIRLVSPKVALEALLRPLDCLSFVSIIRRRSIVPPVSVGPRLLSHNRLCEVAIPDPGDVVMLLEGRAEAWPNVFRPMYRRWRHYGFVVVFWLRDVVVKAKALLRLDCPLSVDSMSFQCCEIKWPDDTGNGVCLTQVTKKLGRLIIFRHLRHV